MSGNLFELPIGDLSRLKEKHYKLFRDWFAKVGKPKPDRYEACKAAFVFGLQAGFIAAQEEAQERSVQSIQAGIEIGRKSSPGRRQITLIQTSELLQVAAIERLVGFDPEADIVVDFTEVWNAVGD